MSAKKTMNRRRFLGTGAAGLAAIGAVPAVLSAGAAPQEPAKPGKDQRVWRTLGKTGIRLPVVSMGVMNADNPDLVRAALESGIVMLDTAHGYQRGRNEEMIGQVIKGRPRDSFVIATKVPGQPMDRETGLFTAETSAEAWLEKVNISLQRLGLEYVDILYLHNVWKKEAVQFEPLLSALQKAKKAGKTRFIGLSTHMGEPEVLQAAAELKAHDVVLTAINFREDHRAETQRAIAAAAKVGIGIVAMKTQAGIYWDKEKLLPINMKAALKWVLADANVATAIPGFTTFEQMREDLEVMPDLALSDKEKADLVPPSGVAGLYCQGCRVCQGQCPRRLPIPELMRSYMYARAYRNLSEARDLVASLSLPERPCGDCRSCTVRCAMGFAVGERIREISGLAALPASLFA